MEKWQAFADYVAEINDLLCTINILNWDANTNMPPAGASTRGRQLATLAKIAQERLTSTTLGHLLDGAETALANESADSYHQRALQQTRLAYDVARRVPKALLGELALNRSVAEKSWIAAKKADDFSLFAPHLARFIVLNRQLTEAIGFDEHPYDAMLLRYEPDMTAARLRTILGELLADTKPLLDQIVSSGTQMPVAVLNGHFPIEKQKAFCYELAEKLGYDLNRGHFAVSAHPFEISFTREDVRITNRYQANYVAASIFGMIHEVGHALYEQGIDPALTRTALATDFLSQYAVGGVSFGTHESQSRLWENQIGRSLPFWRLHYPALQAHFPEALAAVPLETFHRAVNHVSPSCIRVEADEVTYNFHIMLRVEMEMGMLAGTIEVEQLPALWNERMEALLGIVPTTDRVGVLQDVHWSFGQMGTFPAYTIGNVMSAQIFAAARAQVAGLDDQLEQGSYDGLLDWLQQHIYRHGRAYNPDELMTRVTGSTLHTRPYLAYLQEKYGTLYGLNHGN